VVAVVVIEGHAVDLLNEDVASAYDAPRLRSTRAAAGVCERHDLLEERTTARVGERSMALDDPA